MHEICIAFRITLSYSTIIILTPYPLSYLFEIFTHLELCFSTATHNFKWVKISNIRLAWDQTFANRDVETHISFPITVN